MQCLPLSCGVFGRAAIIWLDCGEESEFLSGSSPYDFASKAPLEMRWLGQVAHLVLAHFSCTAIFSLDVGQLGLAPSA